MKIEGYQFVETLHDGARTTLLRARRLADQHPVVIKQIRTAFPSGAELMRLRREHDLARTAAGPGVVEMYGMHAREGMAWLEMEDFHGGSLEALCARRRPTVREALTLAGRLVDALDQVHQAGVVHKDVSPSNVLIAADSQVVKLIDFGIASTITFQVPLRVDRLEGTPAYMSPEQTGRMNRALDWRSDYYSLGATLYHVLTGTPPFPGSDPIETVYAHIARRPTPPHALNPQIPEAVSEIVMTLLAKRADDRYQTAAGLRSDLERCLAGLREGRTVRPFTLRSEDHAEKLRIPDALFGRTAEITALDAAIERVAGGSSEALFVTGPAGMGKTSIVGEVHRGAATHRALFVAGKFEQFQRDVPYASVLRALRHMIHQVLALEPARVEAWRTRFDEALGDTGGIITEALPDLEILVGKKPSAPEVSAIEAENRFCNALVRLVAALTDRDRPTVFLLDDLQWADPASLVLLERLLLDPALHRMLLLGTWRSDEVDDAHPLSRALARAKELGARTTQIELAPLTCADVGTLLAGTLDRPTEEVAELAQLGHLWTGGNPFMVHRVVERLRDVGLLFRDGARWTWDLPEITRRGLGEDVAGFMAGRLAELPAETCRVLEAASCVGAEFGTGILATTLQCTRSEVMARLRPAIALRLVHPLHEDWWPDATDDVEFDFAFAHDRIQEAAHARLDAAATRAIHLRVGRSLRQRSDASVFDVVHHLNLAVDLLTDEERRALGQLDAEAGRRAFRSGAFAQASQLFEQAIALCASDAWEHDGEAVRALTVDAARAASLAGDSDRMDGHVAVVLAHARNPLDRASALEVRALDRAGRDILGAVDIALTAMSELGVVLPRRPAMSDVETAMGAAMGALSALGADGVVALPDLTDPTAAAVIRLANAIMAPAYLAVPLLLPILAAEIVRQTVACGVTAPATYGYAVVALVLTAGGAFEPGYQIGQLCLRLMARFGTQGSVARPGHVVMGYVMAFTLPLREAVALHKAYIPIALAAGDHEYAAWNAHLSLVNAFYAGTTLDVMAEDLTRENRAMRRLGQRAPLDCTEPFRRLVETLQGKTPRCDRLDAEGYTEEGEFNALVASGSRGAAYVLQTLRVFLRFVFRDLQGVLVMAEQGEAYADGASGTYHLTVFHQTVALACIGLAANTPTGDERTALLARARAYRARIAPQAAHAPHNHAHRLLLIDAELSRVEGEVLAAIDGYDAAIEAARKNGFLHEEALANELAGRFHLGRRRLVTARAYLSEAVGAWARWGATAKLGHLAAELPEIVAWSGRGTSQSVTLDVPDAAIDLATWSEAILAITREIRTEALVERILAVSVQNAGATRGLLLLERDGTLRLEALRGESASPRGTPLAQLEGVPLSILQYVARTGAPLVLADARTDPRFASDPRLSTERPLSVLALPLVLRGRAAGLIYLENDLTPDAFPPARIQLQEMLGAQAAISLENARLYDESEALVRSTARFVPTEFLGQLKRTRLIDVVPGDAVELDMTVLFADLRGFTRVTERLGPGPTFALLNVWLGRVTRVIAGRGGFVHDIVGDAVLALFPGTPDDALLAAVEVAAIPREMSAEGCAPADLGVGIGINSGPVMLGTLGGEHRLAISVVGDTVNTASRLEAATKGLATRVLVAQAVVDKLRSPRTFGLRPLGPVALQGRVEPLHVAEFLDVLPSADRASILAGLPEFARALTALREGRLGDASSLFDTCITACPHDTLALGFRERLQRGSGVGGKEDVEIV